MATRPLTHRRSDRTFDGLHAALSVRRPATGIVVVTLSGTDVGEFADAPFQELEEDVRNGPIALFIDARAGKSASIDVSGAWARWLGSHRTALREVSMLTGSRFIELSADLVRRVSDLGERMRLYTEARWFDESLAAAVARAAGQ